MSEDADDRLGTTEEQWERFQAYTHGHGDQDENGIDLSLLRERLRLTPAERLARLEQAAWFFMELRDAGAKARVSARH